MKLRTVLILLAVVALLGAAVAVRFILQPGSGKGNLGRASDAARIKGTITVAGDNYLGYWFITSSIFEKQIRGHGYAVKWVNDGGNYTERHEKFSKGTYDVMVLPVNSYLQHGEAYHYPGVIDIALSDSKGADNVVAYKDRVLPNGKQDVTVNDLNNPALKICYTTDSPSSFLLNTGIVHFDLTALKQKGAWQVETTSSREALGKFSQPEGKRVCDAAVLWEPDVSKALALKDVVSVYGSDQISGMIIDAFVIQRKLVDENSNLDLAVSFFKAYFETLEYYNANREQMLDEMQKTKDSEGEVIFKSRQEVEKAVARVQWFDLQDNCNEWFGISVPGVVLQGRKEQIVDTIVQVTKVMKEVGDIQADPLQGNPYSIVQIDKNRVLAELCQGTSQGRVHIGATVPTERVFPPLSDAESSQLRPIGTMKILPILFQSGTALLTPEGQRVVDEAVLALQHDFSQHRLLIKGHTAPSGDEKANEILSQERAESVMQRLITLGVDENRAKAVGVGSKDPLMREKREGELSYRSRLARVEFILYEDRK